MEYEQEILNLEPYVDRRFREGKLRMAVSI